MPETSGQQRKAARGVGVDVYAVALALLLALLVRLNLLPAIPW